MSTPSSLVPKSLEYVIEHAASGRWVLYRYRHGRQYRTLIGPYATRAQAEEELRRQREMDEDRRRER